MHCRHVSVRPGLSLLFRVLPLCGSVACVDYTIGSKEKEIVYVYIEDTAPEPVDTAVPDDTAPTPLETYNAADYLYQPAPFDKMDIVVSVDLSGSMSDQFSKLGTAMTDLVSDIQGVVEDYRLFVITGDGSYGDLYMGPFDSSSTLMDIQMAVNDLQALAPLAQGEESYAAIYSFWTYDAAQSTPQLRDDAVVLFVTFSDEEEQSGIDNYVMYDWLITLKSDPVTMLDMVNIATLDTSTCKSTIGYKYMDMASTYFSKDAIDICLDTYPYLSQSTFLVATENEITLSHVPVEGSIVVYYFEDPADSSGQNTDSFLLTQGTQWAYDATTNTVTVLLDQIALGSLVIVAYDVLKDVDTGDSGDTASDTGGSASRTGGKPIDRYLQEILEKEAQAGQAGPAQESAAEKQQRAAEQRVRSRVLENQIEDNEAVSSMQADEN